MPIVHFTSLFVYQMFKNFQNNHLVLDKKIPYDNGLRLKLIENIKI